MDASRAVGPKNPSHSLRLEDLSEIKVTFNGERSRSGDRWDIVVMTCVGRYRGGIDGETDARFLRTLGEAAIRAWEPDAMILDLSELDYHEGNALREIQLIGDQALGNESLPLALIVGSRNEPHLRTLFEPDLIETSGEVEWIFPDMDTARVFVDEEIARMRGIFGERRP